MATNPDDHSVFRPERLNPLSLFHRPTYRGTDGVWRDNLKTSAQCEQQLTWDLGALLSTMSLGYALGNRTLFRELSRRPWLAEETRTGDFQEQSIPPHGFEWASPEKIAERLYKLLQSELEQICQGYQKLVLLLSGGLDSRIVAGVVRHLLDQGRIKGQVTAVTWGMMNSRDVVLGCEVAEALKFDWQHVELGFEHLEENIELCRQQLCASVSPIHLHRMKFVMESFVSDTLVLAGSYGDSIGRGEYSGRTLLELLPLRPFNFLGLMRPELAQQAKTECERELEYLRRRAGNQPEYVYLEHQQQGHYMRGLIGQTMSVIHHHAPVYQAFTHPDVYSYMWSVHPAARTDDVYRCLLKILGREVASIPWARTNVTLDASRKDRSTTLPNFHDYQDWTRSLVERQLGSYGRERFVNEFMILDFLDHNKFMDFVDRLVNPDIHFKALGNAPIGVFLWLESLRRVATDLQSILRRTVSIIEESRRSTKRVAQRDRTRIRTFVSSFPSIRNAARKLRRYWLRKAALWRYPVERKEQSDRHGNT